jgi:type IV pilus assembly protein PilY1
VRLNGASKTILAAAAGTGAKGIVAFDVSRPEAFGKNAGALWEFSDLDDPDMGVVTGMPSIAPFQVRAGERRHFVVVSTGQANAGLAGPGRLFLLALDKPAAARWQVNVNYFKFDTGPAGLGAAALVPDEDNTIRFAYAGDLAGIVWRFDFSGVAPWPVAKHLFAATDSGGKFQPIVAKPSVVFAPGGGYLVLFGSGRLLAPEEGLATPHAATYAVQSLYAVRARPCTASRRSPVRIWWRAPPASWDVSATPLRAHRSPMALRQRIEKAGTSIFPRRTTLASGKSTLRWRIPA